MSIIEISIGWIGGAAGGDIFKDLKVLRVLRTLRTLRINRLLRSLSYLFYILDVISRTIGQFIYIFLLIIIFILIYSLLGMNLYRQKFNQFPQWKYRNNFDNIYSAFITVFQIMTLEKWQEILFLAMRSDVPSILTVVYLISWIFMGNYVLLNLFLAILFDGFNKGDKDGASILIEDKEIHLLRQQKDIQLQKEKDRQLTLFLKRQEKGSDGEDNEESENGSSRETKKAKKLAFGQVSKYQKQKTDVHD